MTVKIGCKKKQKSGANTIKAPVGPRTWRAVSDVIRMADVQVFKQSDGSDNALLSIAKRKDKDGKLIKGFHLYPNWQIMFRGQRVKKDLYDFLTILRDTLLENNPPIRIDYRCGAKVQTVRGRIIGFVGTQDDEGLYLKHKKSHNFHLNLKLDRGYSLPDTLKKFQITITGELLPNNLYQYGFCSSLNSRFKRCTDMDYIKNPGDLYWAYGLGRCKAYDLRKGNPKQFCSFAKGN